MARRGADKPKADGPHLRITQVKSSIGYNDKQRKVLVGMGLIKMNRTVVLQDTPSIRGMVAKVPHLVRVEEVEL
jgi:large subunit ribosomal protein L30